MFGNPNTLSPVATLGVITALGALVLTRDVRFQAGIAALVVIDFVVAVKASSLTGWMAFCGAVAAIALVMLGRLLVRLGVRPIHLRAGGLVVVLAASASLPWMLTKAADIFGKDPTLTGRRQIWDFVLDSMGDRWLVGFGWYSFWDDPANVAALEAISYRRFDSAHSTFMESLLFLGAIGLVIVIVVVAASLERTWWEAFGRVSWSMAWWAAVGTFCLLENVTESMIAYHSIFWMLLVAAGFAALRASSGTPATADRDT